MNGLTLLRWVVWLETIYESDLSGGSQTVYDDGIGVDSYGRLGAHYPVCLGTWRQQGHSNKVKLIKLIKLIRDLTEQKADLPF